MGAKSCRGDICFQAELTVLHSQVDELQPFSSASEAVVLHF